jgi:adhesin transport system outer membrane protein
MAAAAFLSIAHAAAAEGAQDTIKTSPSKVLSDSEDRSPREQEPRENLPPPPVSMTTKSEVAGPTTGEVSLYGPPMPKVQRGRLGQIEWLEAPPEVPPALDAAVRIVTKTYPSAKSGRAALRAANSDVKAARWLRFPSISGNIAYRDSDSNPEPQLIVEQPLWSGGRIGANIKRAKAEEQASSAEYVATVQDLAITTARTYFEIALFTRREQLLSDSLREHLRLVATMERRVEQEVSPLADLELARSRSAQVEQEYTSTRSQRLTALRVLAELISDPSYDLGPIPAFQASAEIPNAVALEDQAVAFDPTLSRLNAEADVARADLDARKASILPQINAQYSYDEIYGSRMGLVVRAQTTGGLSQVSEVNSARLRIQSALEARRQAEQRLRRDVAAALIEYDAAKARASISTRASDTAARVSESYVRQFIAGRRSWLDVMNALREAVSAQVGKADAEISAMSTSVQLLLRSGRWRPQFDGPEEPELPGGSVQIP